MKVFLRVFTLAVKQSLEARAKILLWFLVHMSPFVVVPFFWVYVLFEQSGASFTSQKIITYYTLIALVSSFTTTNIGDMVESSVLDGSVVSLIIKPVSFIRHQLALFLGRKVISSLFVIGLFFAALEIFPSYVLLPYSFFHACLFVVALCIAMGISFFLALIIAFSAFWWGRTPALVQSISWLRGLFGGAFAPLTFYPAAIILVAKVLPFQFLYAVPTSVYLGEYTLMQLSFQLIAGLGWLIGLSFLAHVLWKKGMKVYDSPSQ